MIRITILQGKALQAVIDGHDTVKAISAHLKSEDAHTTGYINVLRRKKLLTSHRKPSGIFVYSYTGKEYFAGQSVTQESADVVEAIELDHTRTGAIIEHTGIPRGQVVNALKTLTKYGLVKRGEGSAHKGFEYTYTGGPYWVKDFKHSNNGKMNKRRFNWSLCDHVIFKLPPYRVED